MRDLNVSRMSLNNSDRVAYFFDKITLVSYGLAEFSEVKSPLQYLNAKRLRGQRTPKFFAVKRVSDLVAADRFYRVDNGCYKASRPNFLCLFNRGIDLTGRNQWPGSVVHRHYLCCR